MIIRSFSILSLAIALWSTANAQLATSLSLTKQQYVAGEPVIAVVTITNHAGRELTFTSDGRMPWLDFIMKDSRGASVTAKGHSQFGKMTIKAGESLSTKFDLSQNFVLTEQGNFSVSAVIHLPGSTDQGTGTNRAIFSQSPGRLYWSQSVGIPNRPGQTRQFRILNFAGDQKNQIYAQIVDDRTGQFVRTFLLGDVLMLRKPLATVDRQQRMHVMFLATPTMWVHCEIDTDGKLVNREIHQRGPEGDPQLLTFADGSVRVANSIPYDQKAAAEAQAKIRKASDRPPITY
ncbi:MAG: hypothetical protein ABI162_15440 [Luteolibacter sp.]